MTVNQKNALRTLCFSKSELAKHLFGGYSHTPSILKALPGLPEKLGITKEQYRRIKRFNLEQSNIIKSLLHER